MRDCGTGRAHRLVEGEGELFRPKSDVPLPQAGGARGGRERSELPGKPWNELH